MNGLQELRVKELDRLAATAAGLTANGVKATIDGDDLIVEGGAWRCPRRRPGRDPPGSSPRHGFLVMGLALDRPVTVDDETMIATSFPTFRPLMAPKKPRAARKIFIR